jgi:DNA-binding NtrC family response regulator
MIEAHDKALRDHVGSPGCVMPGTVLIVDNDGDVSDLVADVLRDEGFAVSSLALSELGVARIEPDAVLLDGSDSWGSAAWLHARQPTV